MSKTSCLHAHPVKLHFSKKRAEEKRITTKGEDGLSLTIPRMLKAREEYINPKKKILMDLTETEDKARIKIVAPTKEALQDTGRKKGRIGAGFSREGTQRVKAVK